MSRTHKECYGTMLPDLLDYKNDKAIRRSLTPRQIPPSRLSSNSEPTS